MEDRAIFLAIWERAGVRAHPLVHAVPSAFCRPLALTLSPWERGPGWTKRPAAQRAAATNDEGLKYSSRRAAPKPLGGHRARNCLIHFHEHEPAMAAVDLV